MLELRLFFRVVFSMNTTISNSKSIIMDWIKALVSELILPSVERLSNLILSWSNSCLRDCLLILGMAGYTVSPASTAIMEERTAKRSARGSA